jgi:hypothetical protein
MKKKLILSSIITIIINAVLCIVNLIFALTTNTLPLAYSMSGGDAIIKTGFGIELTKIYSIVPANQSGVSANVSFDIVSLLIGIVAIFIIVFVIVLIICALNKKKK